MELEQTLIETIDEKYNEPLKDKRPALHAQG